MKADAWMPLYVNDYLGATMRLTTEQHGAYLLLIMEGWKSGGPLPDDDAQLAAIVKMTVRDWRKIAPTIRRYFTSIDGELIQGRLAKEVEKAQRLSDARRESGAKGGRPRKQTDNQEESYEKPIGFSDPPKSKANEKQTETPALVARPSPSPSPSETSEPNGSGADGAAPVDVGKDCWRMAKLLLAERDGLTGDRPGKVFGKILSDYSLSAAEMFPAVAAAAANGTQDMTGYLTKSAQRIAGQKGGRLTASERALRSNIQ